MRWLSPKRLLPLATGLIAIGVDIAHHFKLLEHFDVQAAILFVLALLAFDALIERIKVVEKIEDRLERLEKPSILRPRTDLVKLDVLTTGAKSLDACGATLVSLVPPQRDFLLKQLNAGMKMRFVVLDEKSLAWEVWNQVEVPTPHDLETTLHTLSYIMKKKETGSIEVRVAPYVLPSSLVITDGQMNVEFAYNGGLAELSSRPNIHIAKAISPQWFDFFRDRFEELWKASTPYTP